MWAGWKEQSGDQGQNTVGHYHYTLRGLYI